MDRTNFSPTKPNKSRAKSIEVKTFQCTDYWGPNLGL